MCLRLGIVQSLCLRMCPSPSPSPSLPSLSRRRIRVRARTPIRFIYSQAYIVSVHISTRIRSAGMICRRSRSVFSYVLIIIVDRIFSIRIGVITRVLVVFAL